MFFYLFIVVIIITIDFDYFCSIYSSLWPITIFNQSISSPQCFFFLRSNVIRLICKAIFVFNFALVKFLLFV